MIGPLTHLLLALIMAGLVHIATLFAMPWISQKDGYSRLSALAETNRMKPISRDDMTSGLPFADPNMALAVCRYSLEGGPVRVRMPVGGAFVSVLFLQRGIGIFQSVSDRAATQNAVEVVIATAAQMQRIRMLDTDDDTIQEIRIIAPDTTGIALVRGLAPFESQRGESEQLVASSSCEQEAL